MIVSALFVATAIFADFLASDLPIVSKTAGKIWLFPNVTQPSALTSMSPSERASQTDWQLPALVAHGPWVGDANPEARLRGPFALPGHPFGTDRAGRDVFARLVHGARNYIVFALAAVAASLLLGGLLGGLAGIFGGITDAVVSRTIETISAFPVLVLVLGVQAAVARASITTLFFAIALTRWPQIATMVRSEVIRIETRDYVMAARALGASPWRVLRRHVAPNIRGQLAALGAFGIPAVVLIEASLDFLGFGVSAPSWGETMSEFRHATHAWWLLAFPGLLLFIMVVAMNIVGEARRARLDPRGS